MESAVLSLNFNGIFGGHYTIYESLMEDFEGMEGAVLFLNLNTRFGRNGRRSTIFA